MANRSYLCCSPFNRIYPSHKQPGFDEGIHIVACDAYSVPALWLPLFRPKNLHRQTFENRGETFELCAPLASRAEAIAQLRATLPHLNGIFEHCGPLDDHVEMLIEAVESVPDGEFVTIDYEEIAYMGDPQFFDENVERILQALAELEPDDVDDEPPEPRGFFARLSAPALPSPGDDLYNGLLAISQFDDSRPFRSPRDRRPDWEEEDIVNLVRLLGSSHLRPVSWDEA